MMIITWIAMIIFWRFPKTQTDTSPRVVEQDVVGEGVDAQRSLVSREEVLAEHNEWLATRSTTMNGVKGENTSDSLYGSLRSVTKVLGGHDIPYFVMFGSLLGLVRNGKPVANDDDVDLAVPSSYYSTVKNMCAESGWSLNVDKDGIFLQIAHYVAVDVYFYVIENDDLLFKWNFTGYPDDPDTWMRVPMSYALPTHNYEFDRDVFSLPNLPVAVVQFLYGTRWRVSLNKGEYQIKMEKGVPVVTYASNGSTNYWNDFYANQNMTEVASPFAVFVDTYCDDQKFVDPTLLDLGCGNARDSAYFASKGFDVMAVDRSASAISTNNGKFGGSNINFSVMDLTDLGAHVGSYDVIYCRWVIHSITPTDQTRVLKAVRNLLSPNGIFFIEARTVDDPLFGKGEPGKDKNSFVHGHYRRFLSVPELESQLIDHGFAIEHISASNEYSVVHDDKPHLVRITAN